MLTRIQSQNFGTERAVRFQLLKKSYNYAIHIHQFAELVIPIENELTLTVNGREERLAPGDAAFILPFEPHGYRSEAVNKIAIFVFSPFLIPDIFKSMEGMVGERSVFTPKKTTLDSFYERVFTPYDFDLFLIKGLLYLTLSDYIESVPLTDIPVRNDISALIVGYINKHLTEDITLDKIAKELSYTPNYLSSRIQEIFGMNLRMLIASIRADKAKYMLIETAKTGLEICYECGFGSERSFHRQFKAITGSTPKEYRKNLRSKNWINHGIIKRF